MVLASRAHFVCSQLQSDARLLVLRFLGHEILWGKVRASVTEAQLSVTLHWDVKPTILPAPSLLCDGADFQAWLPSPVQAVNQRTVR